MRPRCLIDFAQPQGAGGERLQRAFGAPEQCLVARSHDEVRPVLAQVQAAAEAGAWCVGYLRYEAAPAFDRALRVHPADGPLAWFAVHEAPLDGPPAAATGEAMLAWDDEPVRAAFEADLARIHEAVAAGALYQVNHTASLGGPLRGDPLALFQALRRAQPGGYAAYVDTGEEQVLSVSPELFFDWRDGALLTRPMKGTAPRGTTPGEDARQADLLRASAKELAENVMIVDLLRNDISRVARPHSVRVPRLFEVEALPTVWQMTSDVTALTRPGTTLADVFAALFPCGSVTGAPKVQAMRMIQTLEPRPRGVYCGAVGVVAPGGAATFNVAIRTVTAQAGRARCGIGSGITADAGAAGEWREWRHKRAFIERARQPFELLETLALQDGEARHLVDHLARMAGAAAHFGFPWHEASVRERLHALRARHPRGLWRVRLLLGADGQVQAEAHAMAPDIAPGMAPVVLSLAGQPLEMADSEFVRFKTTRREHYDAFAPPKGVFDTVLWNERGELTECTRGSLALHLDGHWLTPAAACGLLPGVARARALRDGWLQEAVLSRGDLRRAGALRFGNSLRGWLPAQLLRPDQPLATGM